MPQALLLNFEDSLTCEITGTVFVAQGAAFIDPAGKFGKCANINGNTPGGGGAHRVVSPSADVYWDLGQHSKWLVHLWFRALGGQSLTLRRLFRTEQNPGVNHRDFMIELGGNGTSDLRVSCAYPISSSFTETLVKVIDYDLDWHHVAFSFDEGVVRMAVDGVPPVPGSDGAWGSIPAAPKYVVIGNERTGSGAANACVDALEIWHDEIPFDMVNGFTPPAAPPEPPPPLWPGTCQAWPAGMGTA